MIAQPAMIGHNNGPPLGDISDAAGLMRRYAWQKAHKAAWRTPPIEIVRLRQSAANQLGLSYKDYTSILLDRGHRPSAIFFGLGGTLVRVRDGALMPGVERKLQTLCDCALFVVVAESARSGIARIHETYSGILSVPVSDGAGMSGMAAAVRRTLLERCISTSQALMVGASLEDQECAKLAKLARFFWAWEYFTIPTVEPHAVTADAADASHAAFRLCRKRPGSRRPPHAPRYA